MSPAEVDEFVAGRRTMTVATNGPTGHPHVVAMWYGFHDGKPAFWTFGRAQKVVNIRRDPKISALVEDGQTYSQLRGVELVGRARLVEDHEGIVAIGLSVAQRYQNVGARPAQKRSGQADDPSAGQSDARKPFGHRRRPATPRPPSPPDTEQSDHAEGVRP